MVAVDGKLIPHGLLPGNARQRERASKHSLVRCIDFNLGISEIWQRSAA
jgi:hypothetical protein